MKVKKFRIKPRLGIVARLLKSQMAVKELPADIEKSIPQENPLFLTHLSPLAFYNTWSEAEKPPLLKQALQEAGFSKIISVSAVVSTIGSSAEDYLSDILMRGETTRAQLVTAFCEDASDAAFQFVYKLLVDEAKNDDCEVSEALPVSQNPLLTQVLTQLEAEQEGVVVDQGLHLSPRFTQVALVGWWPVSKKKKVSLSSKGKKA